jgi:LemA protein
VKGYAKHESETLLSVVAARNAVAAAATQSEKLAGEAQLTKSLKSLNVVAESYPEMKANSNFQELMRQLQSVENDITNARKYYNGCVKKYNIRLQSFPSSVIGGMFHFEKKNLFEISDVAERDNVKVEF